MTVITKGLGGRQDFKSYDGVSTTFSRLDSTGGTQTLLAVNDWVDVLTAYGDGTNYTRGSIDAALRAIGSSTRTIKLAVGTWTIDSDLTIPANVTTWLPAGSSFSVDSGITLTINGPIIDESVGWFSGSGSLVVDNTTPAYFNDFESAYAADLSGFNIIKTHSFHPSWSGSTNGPKGGAFYHWDGTTGTASTAYADYSGFFDANGDGFRLAIGQELNVYMFGAYIDGSTDDAPYVQYAENYIESLDDGTTGNIKLKFGPGVMVWKTEVNWKGGVWESDIATSGTRIIWNGSAGATPITRTNGIIGGLSFAHMKNMHFREGSAIPATWLDCSSAEFVDAFFNLDNVHFYGSSSDMIKVNGWVNLLWRKVRIDKFGGFAISAITRTLASGSQYLSVFSLDQFTCDSKGACAGVIELDNSTVNGSNIGIVNISNGRIELNDAPMTGNKGIITIKQATSSPNPRAVGLHINNVTLQIVSAAQSGSDVLLYRETTDTNGNDSIMLTNFRQDGLNAIVGGTQPTYWPTIPLISNYGYLAINTEFSSYNRYTQIIDQIYNLVTDRDSEIGYRLHRGAESYDRLYINAKAEIWAGAGSSDVDLFFARGQAGVFRIGGGGSVAGNVQTNANATDTNLNDITHAINTLAKYSGKLVFNSTIGVLIYASGSAAGSVWKKVSDDTTANTPV